MKNLFSYILFLFVLSTISCERLFIDDDPKNSPLVIFDELWQTIDEKYSFFEYKEINWDSLYVVYSAQIDEDMTELQLFDVLANLLFELRDGHVNIVTNFNLSRNWNWYQNYPVNFYQDIIDNNYLGNDHVISGPLRSQIIHNIGYIQYRSFASTISASNIDFLIEQMADVNGIIIDIRNNGGGSLANANMLISRFADERRLTGYRVYKSGPAHNEFTDPVPIYDEPAGPRQITGIPVVILTNRRAYSASNQFVMRMKEFPHVTIIGDRTGGGGGTPVNAELPNGWRYRFSSNMTLDASGNNVESGIDPDYQRDIRSQDYDQNRDTIIESAMRIIRRELNNPND